MPAKNGFEIGPNDLDLLQCVFQLRIATIDHLSALTGRSVRALWGRLLKLRQRRYLSSATRFMQKRVYGLGARGVEALIDSGYAPAELAAKRLRHNELSEIGIRHALFIADIHTRVILLTRDSSVALSEWTEGQSLWDSAKSADGADHLPIRPDAYFVLKPGGSSPEAKDKIHIFLEADRSTMAHTRMETKLTGYLRYHDERRHAKKYPGMQSFIVATVTRTRARAFELRRHLSPLIPRAARPAYPFIAFEDLALASLAPGRRAPLTDPASLLL